MKNMELSNYFEIIHPEYVFLRIKPMKSIRNYNSDSIIATVAGLYRSVFKQIQKNNKKYFFNVEVKLGYYIYLEHDKIEFYFIIPKEYKGLLLSKIRDVWTGVTIEEVSAIPSFSSESIKYSMNYTKQDAYSLSCDKRNNVLLAAICQNISIMDQGDRVGIFYNFIPKSVSEWRNQYDKLVEEMKKGSTIYKCGDKAFLMLAFSIVEKILGFALEILLEFFSGDKSKTNQLKSLEMSSDSLRKRDKPVVNTQIVVMTESKDIRKANNLAMSMCESFKSVSGDNELTYGRFYNKEVNLTKPYIKHATSFVASSHECQNFLSLPAKEIIEEYKIDCINTIETEVPEKLRSGYISLGVNSFRGNKQEAFLRDNYDQGNFPLVLVGEQGSGKTTYIQNYVQNIQTRNEGCIVIDFIKNCELADSIERSCKDKSKLIVLDMSNVDSVQGIGYNELKEKRHKAIDIVDVANRKALYILTLVDALNVDGEPLSSSMDRYLCAASNVVFLKYDASLKDIVKCLNDHVYRNKCIDEISPAVRGLLQDEISALEELNEYRDNTVVGTKSIKVDGINHRINLLKKDLRLKMMFQKGCEDNVDLVKAMDDGKIVLVKMPQEYFSTPYSKNVIVTYLFTKIWSAMLVRGGRESKPKRFHVIVDEIFQAPTAMQLLKTQEICPQTRKFGCKFVFSCQYLRQIGVIDQTLRSAGASYMLMKGSGKVNFNEFKDELSPYTLEDMEGLEQYSSLNLINYEDGRAKFITKLPRPLSKTG
ncbi:MAG: hypothetical protein RSF40_01715 [Oscillospiraceae bacterium]